ncbi:MAG: 30S ribosomal protein S6, partial [Planctomycetota bacterium]
MNDTMTYEGMFLVEAGRDFGNASEPIKTVLDRAEAEVLSMKPWDERRLAYEIDGRKRALYVLTYFKADPQNMAELDRDAQLNEGIIRMQVLRREDLSAEEINAETPATEVQKQREARAADEEAKADETEGAEASAEGEEAKAEPAEANAEPAEPAEASDEGEEAKAEPAQANAEPAEPAEASDEGEEAKAEPAA